jgi:signal transduction histidine kinase
VRRPVRISLLWKLLAINLPVIGAVIAVIWLAIDFLAADYFSELMQRYKISPSDTHQMFLDAIHRYLIQASVIALVFAVVLSFLLTRKVLRPLSDIAQVSRKVAAGDYSDRVDVSSEDEVGHLARDFNRMADALEKLEDSRRQMVTDFAHELRTPLTNVRGYLEALGDGVVEPSRETFDILQAEIMRLVRLVEDLNQLTKADAARAYIRREEVFLPDLVDQVLYLHRHEFESRRIAVEKRFADGAGRLTGDRDKLLKVLSNMVQNAWQYTPEGGRFRATLDHGPDGVTLAFANTGEGIAAGDLARIFERFHRGDTSRSRARGGTGIGLAIAKQLIEAHGGTIGAESEAGETRVWITLPG